MVESGRCPARSFDGIVRNRCYTVSHLPPYFPVLGKIRFLRWPRYPLPHRAFLYSGPVFFFPPFSPIVLRQTFWHPLYIVRAIFFPSPNRIYISSHPDP